MPELDTKMLVLNSSFDEIKRVEPFVKELQGWANFDDDDYNRIMLTLNEAVNNAIIHGNKEDPDKHVTIKSQYDKGNSILTISVQDEGGGFDPNSIPDPLKEENLLNEGGRGVYLIEQYADKLEFTHKGTKVTITYHLDT
ncbi:MAG: ATP-binding protein [Balneolaceae bacterium]